MCTSYKILMAQNALVSLSSPHHYPYQVVLLVLHLRLHVDHAKCGCDLLGIRRSLVRRSDAYIIHWREVGYIHIIVYSSYTYLILPLLPSLSLYNANSFALYPKTPARDAGMILLMLHEVRRPMSLYIIKSSL